MGFCDKTPFLIVFLGAADLTVVRAITFLKHKKNTFVEHPKMREALAARERGAGSLPPKKMRICVSCDNVITS